MDQLNLMRHQKEIWNGREKERYGGKEGEREKEIRGGREDGREERVCLK